MNLDLGHRPQSSQIYLLPPGGILIGGPRDTGREILHLVDVVAWGKDLAGQFGDVEPAEGSPFTAP